ncbi:MAG: porin [Janthinobacterium lividum]
MSFAKTLLLGSAALIGAASVAQAADLPVAKAAPVDYVRVCDWTGAGFFYIPGTDTCLNIGAQVRIEGNYISNSRTLAPTPGANAATGNRVIVPARDRDETGFLARTRLGIDTRTQTAYGTLRAFVQYQIDRVQGLYGEGGLSGGANTVSNSGGNNATPRRAFIQFAGITAGRVQSFFDFYADNYNYEGIANSDIAQNVFAYTYQVGGGFSATLSIEDRNARNLGTQGLGYITGGADATASSVRYAGETIPDIVGVLRYDQSWGSAQLSGAYHEIQAESGPFGGTNGAGFQGADTDGFAVQGGVRLKLPMLAAGDDLWVEGAYQNGAYLYQDSAYYMNQGFNSALLGGFQHIDRDAIAIHTPGSAPGTFSLQKGEGFSAMFAFNHYFTPNFHDVLFGSYEQASYGQAGRIDWTQGGLGFAEQYKIGNQFLWDPVKNLEFGLELTYARLNQTLAHNVNQAATALPVGISKDPDAFEARLRVERDF